MFKSRRRDEVLDPHYSKEELEKRKRDIPVVEKRNIDTAKDSESEELVFEYEEIFDFEKDLKPIPASIEYVAAKYRRNKDIEGDLKGDLIGIEDLKRIDSIDKLVEKARKKTKDEVKDKSKEDFVTPDEGDKDIFDFAKVPLANEEKIRILEQKHMEFYRILSKIQEVHSPTDFKSAYDIQDRISYLLNHRTLLYKALVENLIKYLNSILEKLEKYFENLSIKQSQFKLHNRKISELKNYKWKTDESIKIIKENQEEAEREIKKSYVDV